MNDSKGVHPNAWSCALFRRSAKLLMCVLSLGPIPAGAGDAVGVKRPITVRDLIELAYIVNPALPTTPGTPDEPPIANPIYSPDGKYFLLVTQRGDLRRNRLQGDIWLFDCHAIGNYVANPGTANPLPKKIAEMSAPSDTPVIRAVRWVQGSHKIAFLGKDGGAFQRLFVADVETGKVHTLTRDGAFVTAYEIKGNTTVYTVLELPRGSRFDQDMLPVGQRSINELLYPNPPAIADLTLTQLAQYPSSLHLQRDGKDLPIDFRTSRGLLRLFIPTLALAGDGRHLVTVAPVEDVPRGWERYPPNGEWFRLKAGPVEKKSPLTWGSMERPEQYVVVDLATGSVKPLLDAPVGRDMGHYISTQAWWMGDNRRVILTNTYLPFSTEPDMTLLSAGGPAIAVVDTSTGSVQDSISLRESEFGTRPSHSVKDVSWDPSMNVITIRHKSAGDDPVPPLEKYQLTPTGWRVLCDPDHDSVSNLELAVRQDLNHPPKLWVDTSHREGEAILWNPNPQMDNFQLGRVSVYHWRDETGKDWSGLLSLPPDYETHHRYPLVIQTHGYNPNVFFADGEYTTASGGRALSAKEMIVLQMDVSLERAATPQEGTDNLAGMVSAIDQLDADGLVDRKRVGIIGFSRTAYHAIFALTHRSDLFAAAVVTNGNFSYVPYVMWSSGTSSIGELQLESEAINGGVPWVGNNLSEWRANAPNFNLANVDTPLLITATERGELISQWETFAGLRRLNKPVEMLCWWKQNTPHILVQPAQRYASQQAVVDWFDFWMNHNEDPDPAKVQQYEGWRNLAKLAR